MTNLHVLTVTASGTLMIMPMASAARSPRLEWLSLFSGSVTVNFANGTFTFSASATLNNLTFGGVTVSGTITTNGSSVTISGLDVNFENGLIQITGGTANLTKGANGLVDGSASGMFSTSDLAGISLSGQVAVAFSSATSTVTVTGTDDTINVLGKSLSGNFTVTDDSATKTVTVAVTGLNISLGGVASVTDGSLNFTLNSQGYSASGSATVAVNLPSVQFNGQLSVSVDSTNGLQISGKNISLDVEGQTLTGNFIFQQIKLSDGSSVEAILFEGVNIYLGSATTGVQISNGYGALLLMSSGVAMDVGGSASIVGVSGLTLQGTLHARVNDTGAAVDQTVSAPQPDPQHPAIFAPEELKFSADEIDFTGSITLQVSNPSTGNPFVSVTGGFGFTLDQSTSGNTRANTILIAAAGINIFVGSGGTTPVGVQVSGANLGLAIFSTTNLTTSVTTSGGFALSTAGTAALLGVPDLTLTGTLAVQVNTTGGAVNQTVAVPDPSHPGSTIPVTINFTASQGELAQVSGNITFAVSTFATLNGAFSFSLSQSLSGTVTTTTLTAGVTNATAFVGSGGTNPIGVQVAISSLNLTITAAVDSSTKTTTYSYSLHAAGSISLVGISGLILTGSATVQTAGATNQTSTANVVGTLNFQVDDSQGGAPVVEISGTVNITLNGSELTVAINPVTFTLTVSGTQLIQLTGEANFTLGPDGFAAATTGTPFAITSYSFLGGPTYTTDPPVTIGPLSISGLSPIFKDFSFKNNVLSTDVGFSAASETLNFGSGAGTQISLTGLTADINLAAGMDLSSFRITSFTSSGAISRAGQELLPDHPARRAPARR